MHFQTRLQIQATVLEYFMCIKSRLRDPVDILQCGIRSKRRNFPTSCYQDRQSLAISCPPWPEWLFQWQQYSDYNICILGRWKSVFALPRCGFIRICISLKCKNHIACLTQCMPVRDCCGKLVITAQFNRNFVDFVMKFP